MHNRILIFTLLLALVMPALSGCANEETEEEDKTYVYYTNAEGTDLEKREIQYGDASTESCIVGVIERLQTDPDSARYVSVFPLGVAVKNWELDDGTLCLHFNAQYKDMTTAEEVLLRAAVVRSLVQIDGVDKVEFYVEDEPLQTETGEDVGLMDADSFVSNTGSSVHTDQEVTIDLYYTNQEGDLLVPRTCSVTYNRNTSLERAIVETLMKNPRSGMARSAIPEETKILSVSVDEDICYVNLDSGFTQPVYDVQPEIIIYSIVDSVIEGGNVSQVQILVNGETDLKYQDKIDLSKPFTMNTALIEE